MLVALVGLMYFMLIRPAQTKAREQQALLAAIEPGSRIMTSSGIFGTIRHIGDSQVILEISPGVELTILKQAILRQVKPDEDEFEYDDEDAPEVGSEVDPVAAPDSGDDETSTSADDPQR